MMNILTLTSCICVALARKKTNSHKDHCSVAETYDYIIVGAGTSGSALASQLSRDGDSVLLIEEGGWSNQFQNTILAQSAFDASSDPLIERGYVFAPQKEWNDRSEPYNRGKVTGGGGSLNFMLSVIGNRLDFDERWGPIDNWTWDDDLKYYWEYIESTFRTVIEDRNATYIEEFIRAAERNGFAYNPDHNDLSNNGQGGVALRRHMGYLNENGVGIRESSWTAYMQPILPSRDNLDVIVYTRVNKILFENCGNKNKDKKKRKKRNKIKAIGVETVGIGDRKTQNFHARKEVILSAGAIDTPKILMLSGVGKCDELEALDIECVVNLDGVGKSLEEHTWFQMWSPALLNQDAAHLSPQPFPLWGVQVYEDDGEDTIDLGVGPNWIDGRLAFGATGEIFQYESRGEVLLRDNNPESVPIIDPNYWSTDRDRNKFVTAIQRARELLYTPELLQFTEAQELELSPGWDVQSDAEILEWGRANTLSQAHASCTCKMGADVNDDAVVVDARLRVKGIQNLRVADTSILPRLISGNSNQIAIIVGFKAADFILEENGGDGQKVYQQ